MENVTYTGSINEETILMTDSNSEIVTEVSDFVEGSDDALISIIESTGISRNDVI